MPQLPITRMILYKHGVGYFERRAKWSGDRITLALRVEEMNDVLKSLTPIDWGDGQVLGVEYATPQEREERLTGCSVHLNDAQSLQDLLVSLRGRRVELHLDQGESWRGLLLGLDRTPEEQPLAGGLVSLLLDESSEVRCAALGRLQGVTIVDEQGAADLRFFLQTALVREEHNQVIIRLTPGEHDLSVGYIAPAPTWRVSYRLVLMPPKGETDGVQALLMGWGIFDNRLEEDMVDVQLSLVAGMPVSFVYDLYTPFTPERPEVQEEQRTVARPVMLEERLLKSKARRQTTVEANMPPVMLAEAAPAEMMEATAPLQAAGKALGELFQYDITTPVTVGRGQSAMAPIVSARLACSKALIYNGAQLSDHPVATLRLTNATGVALERGPVTVLDNGSYVGEALLAFTPTGGEIVVPYAVELGVTVYEQRDSASQVRTLALRGRYLQVEEWDIRRRKVSLHNTTDQPKTVLIDHPRQAKFTLFDTPAPAEQTASNWRFSLTAAAGGEAEVHIQERRIITRREEITARRRDSFQNYLGLSQLTQADRTQMQRVLGLWTQIDAREQEVAAIETERKQIYQTQEQVRANMQALSTTGKEGTLRASYVEKLEQSEAQLQTLATRIVQLRAEITALNASVDDLLGGQA